MKESKFKLGDVVRLKSSEFYMTVDKIKCINDCYVYKCVWFNDGELQTKRFIEHVLIKKR